MRAGGASAATGAPIVRRSACACRRPALLRPQGGSRAAAGGRERACSAAANAKPACWSLAVRSILANTVRYAVASRCSTRSSLRAAARQRQRARMPCMQARWDALATPAGGLAEQRRAAGVRH